MMRSFAAMAATVGLGIVGCSSGAALKETPASVSGKVSQAGRPVGDVVVSFHPLDRGHPVSFPVKPDGTFQGELIAGNYAYYVGQSKAPNSAAALKKVAPQYLEADLGRSVAVQPGQELVIALD
jgi:hypothetical protein